MKKVLLSLAIIATLGAKAQTFSIIRKQILQESSDSKVELVKQALKDQINPFSSFSMLPKKYVATLSVLDSTITFTDAQGTLELKIKQVALNMYICRDAEENEYMYQVIPTGILLNYTGSGKVKDLVYSKMIFYTTK
jgi:hypothetical protein